MKPRISRKLKKQFRNNIISYDFASCPKGLSVDQLLYIIRIEGLIVYDSSRGDKPTLLYLGKKKTKNKIKIKDVK